ncbi:DUF3226 domain-containing protein [Dickeya oryzae]|uniref:DUF3226 domain-containing protein n=1 Tax=Dickeya oryzae TaxID=1240404 RepID=UPI001AEC9B9F|nr:DUF3226 domain-containing protein [Dickeya oryzae]
MNSKGISSRMVVTEGASDMHVIFALCKKHSIPDGGFTVYDVGSDDQVIKYLRTSIIGSNPPEILGVVIDADNPDLKGKWNKLKDILETHGYVVPENPLPEGTIITHDTFPKIGIWLMPDNQVNGMLEDFCHQMASVDHIEYAKQCALNARQAGIGNFIDNHLSKATMFTYLAWQDSPGRPIGQSISANVLHYNVALANNFILFIKNLFFIDD